MAENSSKLLEVIAHWLENDRLGWVQRKACSTEQGKADAAFKIADEIMQLSQFEVQFRSVTHLFERSHLASLLRRKYRLDQREKLEQTE